MMMMNLTFYYFQLSVSILVGKQQSNMPLTAAEKIWQFQKILKEKGPAEEMKKRDRQQKN
jgi:hypothetical protein